MVLIYFFLFEIDISFCFTKEIYYRAMVMKNFKDYIKPATSTGLYEMDLNPITLAFPGDLEEKFLGDYYKNSMILIRISLRVR